MAANALLPALPLLSYAIPDSPVDTATETVRTTFSLEGEWKVVSCWTSAGDSAAWDEDAPMLEIANGKLRADELPEFRKWRQYRLTPAAGGWELWIEGDEKRPKLQGTCTLEGDELVLHLHGKMRRALVRKEGEERRRVKGLGVYRVLRLKRLKAEEVADRRAREASLPAPRRGWAWVF
jgi:hypothetical protein